MKYLALHCFEQNVPSPQARSRDPLASTSAAQALELQCRISALKNELDKERERTRQLEDMFHRRIDELKGIVRYHAEILSVLRPAIFPEAADCERQVYGILKDDGRDTIHLDARKRARLSDPPDDFWIAKALRDE
ncbi:MAG: hypothetical protein ISS15_21175 [Alphaproteobacteria bacterium]|nr:hypothetical protein [Reyranella sp.]MBL6940092.1 hypothetical protein [Alphaproteobacteria bacterium]MBL7100179.1 hypothetical protein [Alphaproteobacteria bacterium]